MFWHDSRYIAVTMVLDMFVDKTLLWQHLFLNRFKYIQEANNKWFTYRQELQNIKGVCVLRYIYTLWLIGPILYPDECDLMVNPQKYIHHHFLTNAFCYLRTYITCQLIAVCKRSLKAVITPRAQRVLLEIFVYEDILNYMFLLLKSL